MIVVGFDPGGAGGGTGKSGVAIINYCNSKNITANVKTVNSVEMALKWVGEFKYSSIDALGVDTLLSWSSYKGGWRSVDKYLRRAYPNVKNSVISPNALYGAMALQGVLLAIKLKLVYKDLVLNETHPKVQYYSILQTKYNWNANNTSMSSWLLQRIGISNIVINNDNEWDALFSAWATYMGVHKLWTKNLSRTYKSLYYPAGVSNYYWP